MKQNIHGIHYTVYTPAQKNLLGKLLVDIFSTWKIQLRVEKQECKTRSGKLKTENQKWKTRSGNIGVQNQKWKTQNRKLEVENLEQKTRSGNLALQNQQ